MKQILIKLGMEYIGLLAMVSMCFGILILLGILSNDEVMWYDIFIVAFMLLSFKYLIVI